MVKGYILAKDQESPPTQPAITNVIAYDFQNENVFKA
jgi:hypothetical protein